MRSLHQPSWYPGHAGRPWPAVAGRGLPAAVAGRRLSARPRPAYGAAVAPGVAAALA